MKRKTANFTFRLTEGVLEALRIAATKEQRSAANLLEVLIREHCRKAGIRVEEENTKAEGA